MDTPAQSASVFGNDNIVVQASGSGVNVNIGTQPHLKLTEYERRTKLAARNDSEASLLSAYRADVVPLIGRDSALADLRRWLDTEALVSVRILVGAGGRGKTRLALELAREKTKQGWLAGFATAEELDRFRGQHGVEQWRWDKPILIIVDYAASRAEQLRAWFRELVDASFEGHPALRLLLLERQANTTIGWLAAVFGQANNDESLAAMRCSTRRNRLNFQRSTSLNFVGRFLAPCSGERTRRWKRPRTAPTPNSIDCLLTTNGQAIPCI